MSVIGLWAFSFGNGNGTDGSGNVNTALFQNGASQNTEGEVVFDGLDDYVEIPDGSQYAITEGTLHLTFSADVGSMDGTRSTNVNDTSMQALVSRDSSGFDGGGHLTIYLDGDGSIYIRHQSDTDDYLIRTAPDLVAEGEDIDLVYSFSDTGGMTVYINGVEVGSNTDAVTNGDSLALSQNNEPWTLGVAQTLSDDGVANKLQQFFDGSIGHFEIYDEPLAPSDLNTLHDLSDGSDDGVITGTVGDDTIHGGNTVDEADGGAVIDDTISAGAGDDQVYAGDGADNVNLGDGADFASGGFGSDTISGDDGNDTIEGEEGNDVIFGGAGDDNISGGAGNDFIRAGIGADTVQGGEGNDSIDGGDGADVLLGGTGSDAMSGGAGNDALYGDEGDDTVLGGAGDDTIFVGAGNDSVYGGDGADSIALLDGFGSDTITGGEGGTDTDLVDLQFLTTGATVDFTGDESGSITHGTDTAEFSEVEHIRLTGQADSLDGSANTAYMGVDGGAGDDTITTGAGDDIAFGGDGSDQIDGGAGSDTIGGGAGDDTLTGGAGADSMAGGAGSDVFVLADGSGADTITDFDTGDSDGDGVFNDQFDVSNLTDSSGNPINAWDVTVTDDGSGNALLTFPNGETVLLQGVAPSQFSTAQQMNAAGIPCYAPGTLIDTPDGPKQVELLQVGDLVTTRDHGPQPIRWTRSSDHPLETVENVAKPVEIKASALGRNLPAHDLIVSPQHRIFVGGNGQLQNIFPTEAFAPAKSLTATRGIRHMKGKTKITWVHFACDRHEVVTANGCLSESLLLGPMVLNGLNPIERRALIDIFGTARTPDAALNGPPARECLTVGKVKRQLAKHQRENGQLLSNEIRKWDRDLAMEQYEAERMRVTKSTSQTRRNALRIA